MIPSDVENPNGGTHVEHQHITAAPENGSMLPTARSEPSSSRNSDAISALKAGQIEGIVVDLPTAFFVVAVELDDGTIVGKLPQRGARERFGLVFEKGNPLVRCVNRALNRLWANGTIKGIQRKYLAQAGAPDLR